MTNALELEIAFKRAGLTKRSVARSLNMSDTGLWKKLKGLSEFKASEIMIISDLLSLDDSERNALFFASEGELNSTEQKGACR